MAEQHGKGSYKSPVSFLIIEGDTEQVFYRIIQNRYLKGIRYHVYNLKGQGNVNRQVIGRIQLFIRGNPNDTVRVYCCIDAERQKRTATPLDLSLVREQVVSRGLKRVLSVNKILADPEIESWFFYDIEGIYGFLRVPRSQKNTRAFKPPEKFGYKDLQKLFERYEKTYTKGKKAKYFINRLNIEKIVSNCKELHEGIELIQSQAYDLTNHLFPARKRKDS